MAIVVGVLVVAALSVVVYHGGTTAFDNWAFTEALQHINESGRVLIAGFFQPAVSVVLLLIVATGAVLRRRFDLLALTVLGPIVTTGLTEQVLKPLVGRTLGPQALAEQTNGVVTGSFPSGHTTVAASTALVVFIAVCQLELKRTTRWSAAVVLTLWIVLVAVGLVRNFFHYATDTFAAVGVAVAVVLTIALLIDRVADSRRAGQFTWRS